MSTKQDAESVAPAVVRTNGLDRGVWTIAAVASLGSFLAQLDATMINVAVPTLVNEFQTTASSVQWVISGYLLALTTVLPLSGRLIQWLGGRNLYLVCYALFAASSFACGLAWSLESLITFRLVQGLSGGLLAPLAQTMIVRSAGAQFARVASFAAIPILMGPILGPVLAGYILGHLAWPWLFHLTALVAVMAIPLVLRYIPQGGQTRRDLGRFDWAGLAMLSPGLALFLYAMDRLADPIGLFLAVAALVMLAGFVRRALRLGSASVLDLALFQNPSFRSSAITQFLANGSMLAVQITTSLYLASVLSLTSSQIGTVLAAVGIGMILSYSLAGRLIERFGTREVGRVGSLLAVLASGTMVAEMGWGGSVWALCASLFVLGIGQSAIGLSAMTKAYKGIEEHSVPIATTSMAICQRLGGPIVSTASVVIITSLGEGVVHISGYTASLVIILSCYVGCLLAFLRAGDIAANNR